MTLKTSLNKNAAGSLFLFTLKKNAGIVVLITAFMLLICPGYVLMHIRDNLKIMAVDPTFGTYNLESIYQSCGLLLTVITSTVSVILCFVNFSFLYSKKSGDVYHALPVTRVGLFVSRYAASVVPMLLPMLLCYSSLACMLLIPNVSGNITWLLYGFISNIAVLLICTAFTMIFLICAGSAFDLVLSFFGINIGVLIASAAVISLCGNLLTGFWESDYNNVLTKLSPFWFAFSGYSELLLEYDTVPSAKALAVFLIKAAIVIILSLTAAILLYRKRKSEKCGESYAYPFMYRLCGFIIAFVGAFGCGMIFTDGNGGTFFWLFAAAGAGLAAVAFGAITDRGFKTLKKSLLVGGCSIAALLVIHIILWSGGFGFETRIPDTTDIKSVSYNHSNGTVVFKDPSLALALHRDITENLEGAGYYAPDDPEAYYSYVQLDYTLNNGTHLRRAYYSLNTRMFEERLLDLYKSNEAQKSLRENAERLNSATISTEGYFYEGESSYNQMYKWREAAITKQELMMIIDAYASDLKKATADSLYGENITYYTIHGEIAGSERGSYYYENINLTIEQSFTATIQVIESLNLHERVSEDY